MTDDVFRFDKKKIVVFISMTEDWYQWISMILWIADSDARNH